MKVYSKTGNLSTHYLVEFKKETKVMMLLLQELS